MSFSKIVNDYIVALKSEIEAGRSTGEATPELSYRTSLDVFFKSIARYIDVSIVTIPEPRNQNKVGRPDWRFHNSISMGVYGYVEAKGVDLINKINLYDYNTQIEKYLTLGNPVILTDGIDFILFKQDGSLKEYSLIAKPVRWDNVEVSYEIQSLFAEFFGEIGYRIITDNQLVNEVAKRARLLSDEILEFLNLDSDEAENQSELDTLLLLKQLKAMAELNHDKALSSELVFASFIAQILTFGLLYSHRVVDASCEKPSDKYDRIHDFWFSVLDEKYSNKLIPFGILVRGLKSELNSNLSRLGLWYDDLRRLLAHIKLTNEQIEIPDFHELYETFLSVYDPDTKFDYGAFYTPRYLAFYIIELAKQIIKSSLPNVNLKSSGLKIIDPCCGTGTFIEAILKSIPLNSQSNIIGFEILPAPYALAHYRMTLIDKEYPENIKIILTNTLSDNLFNLTEESLVAEKIGSLLVREQREAYHLALPPLTLIVGNPPSSDSKFQVENEGVRVKALIEDFRPSVSERTSRQNTQKQLSNEFVKFLRWTVDRAINSCPSLFILILPSSFAKHPSYKHARKYLLEQFNEIWILEFDLDNRTGSGGENIFQTLQGRLVLAGVLSEVSAKHAEIKYKTIAKFSRPEKIGFFQNKEINLDSWDSLKIDDENFSFKPIMKYNKDVYEKFLPLADGSSTGIFCRHCSSLKLAPTHLLIHTSQGQLKRRSKFISKTENNYESIMEKWYTGQRKPPSKLKITQRVKEKLAIALDNNSIVEYSYRPFIEAKVLIDDELLTELQGLGGGGTRDRPEIRSAYSSSNVFGFAVSPAPEDIGENLHKFSSFCWFMPDNDLSARGNAHVFCNYFPEYKKGDDWDSTPRPNINESLLKTLCVDFQIEELQLMDHVVFYCYSILSSEYYLDMFKGKLFGVAGEWPRIPVTKSKSLFLAIVDFGKKIAEIESNDFELNIAESDVDAFTYFKFSIDADTITLKDETGRTVKKFSNIPLETISFKISGYSIIKEWLKLHSFPYFRKELSVGDIRKFNILLNKIDLYIDTISNLDFLVEQVIDGEVYDSL